tara:strand:+ start:264 stop:590 length:327 start_codon:yes stop_codon:yes gene_type:complete
VGALAKNIIYLNNRDSKLNEQARSKFAGKVQTAMLDLYYAGIDVPLKLVGTQSQINSFMGALKREKRYMDSYMKHGLDDARTLGSRHDLMHAVRAFERETGLRWPFKN